MGIKVIIAVDSSDIAEKTFKWYFDNVYKKDHEIIVAYCMELPIVLGGSAATTEVYDNLLTDKYKEVEAIHHKYGKLLKEKHLGGRFVSATHARPCEWLVDLAKKEQVELVVTGCRGQGLIRRTILGSVSTYMLHHLHCPIIVYNLPQTK